VNQSRATSFQATLYRISLVRWVDVPKAAVDRLQLTPAETRGAVKGWNAVLRFQGDVDRVTLFTSRKRGHYKLAFKVELLKAAGVDAGDTIEFTLEPDRSSREPELPAEMVRVFGSRPELRTRWQAHSVAMRRQVVRYIEQAKSPEVQAKRCWIFLERLAETGKLGAD
jgi:hypothetical protein